MFKVEFYQDKNEEWRWRFKASNGNIVADSGEGYKNKAECIAEFNNIQQAMRYAYINRVIEGE